MLAPPSASRIWPWRGAKLSKMLKFGGRLSFLRRQSAARPRKGVEEATSRKSAPQDRWPTNRLPFDFCVGKDPRGHHQYQPPGGLFRVNGLKVDELSRTLSRQLPSKYPTLKAEKWCCRVGSFFRPRVEPQPRDDPLSDPSFGLVVVGLP